MAGKLAALGGGKGIGAILGGAGTAASALGANGQQQITSQMHPEQLAAALKLLKGSQGGIAAGQMASISAQKKSIPLLDKAYKGAQANAALAGSTAKTNALSHEKQLLGEFQQGAVGAGTTGLSTYGQGIKQIGSGTSQTLANIDAAVAKNIGDLGIESAGMKSGVLGGIGDSYQNAANANANSIAQMVAAIQGTLHKEGYTALGKKKKPDAMATNSAAPNGPVNPFPKGTPSWVMWNKLALPLAGGGLS